MADFHKILLILKFSMELFRHRNWKGINGSAKKHDLLNKIVIKIYYICV